MIRKVGLFLVMIGALTLSFAGQVQAVEPLLGRGLAVVFATTTDLATLLALNEVTISARATVRRWAWSVLLLAGGTALGLNTWHALGTETLPGWAAVAVGAGPVVLAWLLSHVVALVLTEKREAEAVTASEPTPAAETEPSNAIDAQTAPPADEPPREAPAEASGSTLGAVPAPAQQGHALTAPAGEQTGADTDTAGAGEALSEGAQTGTDPLPTDLIDRAEKAERQALQRHGGKRGLAYREAPRRLGVRYDTARAALDAARARINAEQQHSLETAA